MRAIGVSLIFMAVLLEAFGLTGLVLAVVGEEWDYCPSGGECIAGEAVGLAIMLAAAALGLLGARVGRRRPR